MTKIVRFVRVFAVAVGVSAVGVGCAPRANRPYDVALARAARAKSAGRHDEAVAHYDEAARAAKRQHERDFAEESAILLLTRSGDVLEATRRLEALASQTPKTTGSVAAEYRLARLRIAHGDEDEKRHGYRALDAFVRKHPESGLARPALRAVLIHKDETEGLAGALAYAEELAPRLEATELGETLAYAVATRLRARGDREAALARFLAQAQRWPYPQGALWDDALFAASELEEELGHAERARAHLERMLREHERSSLVGSYQRPKYVPAMKRLSALYEKSGDLANARAALRRLYEEFPTSTERDDALFREAELFAREGRSEDACARLRVLVREFPHSRYTPCARERCAGLERMSAPETKSKTCAAYIDRRR